MQADAKAPPLIILGIDAGDPVFIRRWAAQGYLPAMASIMERGCWARTAGPELISEHGVWISLFSGLSRSQHGYYYFRQLNPGTYDLMPIRGPDINAHPFWSVLQGQRKKKAAIIDAPDAIPRPGLPGIQLANWATHNNWDPDHFATATEPPELLREVQRKFGEKQITLENHESSFQEDLRIYKQLLPRIAKKGELCRDLFGRQDFDLFVTVFAESHLANHQFWQYCPEVKANRNLPDSELTHAIRDVYRAIDYEIGLLLEGLPAESNLFIVSSVGMEDKYPTTGLAAAFFRQLGYQVSAEPGPLSLHPMALARRVLPESWRIALSRHLPREKREELLAEQFRSGTNWSRTAAFAIPTSYTSFVRVNLRGREPEGIVDPNGDYEALLDRIESDFRQLVDPQTNEPAVARVARTTKLFGGGPPESLPDMFVDWRSGRFLDRVVHPHTDLIQKKPDFYRRSDHSKHGFMVAAGPGIQALGELDDISVLDLAPTFLNLLGEPVPQALSGHVIRVVRETFT